MEKFSKKKLVAYLEKQINGYEIAYGFRSFGPNTTVKARVENNPEVLVAFGKWKAYRTILEDLSSGDL